jgi:hypothetical protein
MPNVDGMKSGMKFAIPSVRLLLESRTRVRKLRLSQASVIPGSNQIQCGRKAFLASKIKGNPQTPEYGITL